MNIRKKMRTWCPQPKNPFPTKIATQPPISGLFRADFRKSPIFFVCLSAFLLVLGTYLRTLEIPVQIATDPSAAEQTEIRNAFWPLSFALWVSAVLFLGYSLNLRYRKHLGVTLPKRLVSRSQIALTIALGVLILFSTFLSWVIVEAPNLGYLGSTYVGQYHKLTGFDLIKSNHWMGDVMYLVFAAVLISVIYIPALGLALSGRRVRIASAFLSILGGISVIGPILSVATTKWSSWSIPVHIADAGGGGGVQGTVSSLGIGLLVAAVLACGLVFLGISDIVKMSHIHSNSVTGFHTCAGKE